MSAYLYAVARATAVLASKPWNNLDKSKTCLRLYCGGPIVHVGKTMHKILDPGPQGGGGG